VGPVLALRLAPHRRESYAQLGGLDCEHGGGSDVEEANREASRNKWILELQDRSRVSKSDGPVKPPPSGSGLPDWFDRKPVETG